MPEIRALVKGYRDFHQEHFVTDPQLYQRLKDGQSPKTLVITCCDSRIDPLTVTKANPGEMFVVRNVANLVPPYQPNPESLHGVSAALEFGVCHLKVKHIVVMGHSNCGGIKALREGVHAPEGQEFSFIAPWMEIAESARGCDTQEGSEQEAIRLSLSNLLTFPWIKSAMDAGMLKLHGWYFRIEDGQLLALNESGFEAV